MNNIILENKIKNRNIMRDKNNILKIKCFYDNFIMRVINALNIKGYVSFLISK